MKPSSQLKRTPMPPRKDYLKRLPAKGRKRPLRKRSLATATKVAKAVEHYPDGNHVYFSEASMQRKVVAAVTRSLPSDIARIQMEKLFIVCFWCDGPGFWHPKGMALTLEMHHIIGAGARSDELTNLFPCHHACHMELQSDAELFGKVLYRKWRHDRVQTSWPRLMELLGHGLPDLIID